jgi:hypothetical protein
MSFTLTVMVGNLRGIPAETTGAEKTIHKCKVCGSDGFHYSKLRNGTPSIESIDISTQSISKVCFTLDTLMTASTLLTDCWPIPEVGQQFCQE